MRKFGIFLIGCFIAYQARADYYEDFAKQYEKDHPEIVYPQKKTYTSEELFESWTTAARHFKPGYKPVLDENGVLLDWVPTKCPKN